MTRVRFIDSHTEGEPTRVILSGGPDLGGGTVARQAAAFRERFDWFRSAAVNEPRGCDALVGAMLCTPADPAAAAGVFFFNNVGPLHSCGHGTIGLVRTLAHLGRLAPGTHRFETPVGPVAATLDPAGAITIRNVPSFRHARAVTVPVPKEWGTGGSVTGDVAWGGNWFFLIERHALDLRLDNLDRLNAFCRIVRQGLAAHAVTGRDGAEIDHIELFGPPTRPECHSRNFVLCPGGAYDRSPCGTGTSAKVACLHADGRLAPGTPWRQESIIGSAFTAVIDAVDGQSVIPTISGGAWITAEGELHIDDADPFRHGIPAAAPCRAPVPARTSRP